MASDKSRAPGRDRTGIVCLEDRFSTIEIRGQRILSAKTATLPSARQSDMPKPPRRENSSRIRESNPYLHHGKVSLCHSTNTTYEVVWRPSPELNRNASALQAEGMTHSPTWPGVKLSGRQDSNLRFPHPKCGGLPLAYARSIPLIGSQRAMLFPESGVASFIRKIMDGPTGVSPICLPVPITGVLSTPEVVVGMAGFEPAAPSSRTKCAAKLRHIPKPESSATDSGYCFSRATGDRCGPWSRTKNL
jgi:hypothetical protein